jgi:hypothetical protein
VAFESPLKSRRIELPSHKRENRFRSHFAKIFGKFEIIYESRMVRKGKQIPDPFGNTEPNRISIWICFGNPDSLNEDLKKLQERSLNLN